MADANVVVRAHPLACSLPFIDDFVNGVDVYSQDESVQAQVKAMVEAEMREMKRDGSMRDYLKLAVGDSVVNGRDTFEGSPALKAEYNRIANGGETDKLQGRNPAADESKDFAERIETAETHVEEQQKHITNLELLQCYGANAWKLHAADLEGLSSAYYNRTLGQAQRLELLNQERRGLQEESKKRVHALESEFYHLADRNRRMRAEVGSPSSKKQRTE